MNFPAVREYMTLDTEQVREALLQEAVLTAFSDPIGLGQMVSVRQCNEQPDCGDGSDEVSCAVLCGDAQRDDTAGLVRLQSSGALKHMGQFRFSR